ncbi:hypothetical protein LJC63_13160, partial [Ruminococcaceae bacterium OttesenSCG-928-L11]|nr:hypothetical protein [Ruminococcaceae bacterium OttesenSCG-928-L11]
MKRLHIHKWLAVLLALAMVWGGAVPAFAYDGILRWGDYSDTKQAFAFEPSEMVLVYNGEAYLDVDFETIWPGSDLYIPVYTYDNSDDAPDDNDPVAASDKDIKNHSVTVSYKASMGDQYISGVELVNGKKAKVKGLESGVYAKISFNTDYTGSAHTTIKMSIVLSVKKASCPETLTSMQMSMINRQVNIDRDTIYTAQSPIQFYAMKQYGGGATFDFGSNVKYEATVAKGKRYYLNLDRSAQSAIADMYPDAYIEYFNFIGDRDTFEKTGKLQIPINRAKFTPKGTTKAQVFVYEVQKNKLVSLNESVLSFDAKKNILTLKTKTLNNYILVNQALFKD